MPRSTRSAATLIGLTAAGNAALGNTLDGVQVESANNNLIGQIRSRDGRHLLQRRPWSAPSRSAAGRASALRDTAGQYLITGTSDTNGLLFDGTIAGVGHELSPSTIPDAYDHQRLRSRQSGRRPPCGSSAATRTPTIATAPVTVNGFLFQGTTADLSTSRQLPDDRLSRREIQLRPQHDGRPGGRQLRQPGRPRQGSLPLGPGHAFIYDIASSTFLTDIVFPGSMSNTAYGIWYNGGTSYTICGGYSLDAGRTTSTIRTSRSARPTWSITTRRPASSRTGRRSTIPFGTNFVTHFEGISSVEKGVYTLSADSVQAGTGNPVQGSWVTVRRNTDGSFGPATWVNLNYPGVDPSTQHHQLQFGVRQPGGRHRHRPGGHLLLPGDGQHRLPVVERDQRQRRQRHRAATAPTTTRSP